MNQKFLSHLDLVVVVILMCFLQCHGLSIEGFVLPSSTTREVMSDYTLHMKLREKFYCFSIFYFIFFFKPVFLSFKCYVGYLGKIWDICQITSKS